jgi:predicted 3-demethylubiquinone-9 3-methyltransferase (glyoxalase superfamily)
MQKIQTITPFFSFKKDGEEAVKFYVSLFSNARIISMMRSEGEGRIAKGGLAHATFELAGQQFMAIDGGDYFTFGPGISLFVAVEDQDEVDHLYDNLAKGGEAQPCGWVQDKYGVSWQIIPKAFMEFMQGPPEKSQRVMEALFNMKKIIIKDLQKAYEG